MVMTSRGKQCQLNTRLIVWTGEGKITEAAIYANLVVMADVCTLALMHHRRAVTGASNTYGCDRCVLPDCVAHTIVTMTGVSNTDGCDRCVLPDCVAHTIMTMTGVSNIDGCDRCVLPDCGTYYHDSDRCTWDWCLWQVCVIWLAHTIKTMTGVSSTNDCDRCVLPDCGTYYHDSDRCTWDWCLWQVCVTWLWHIVSIFWQWQVCVTWLWHILSIFWQWQVCVTWLWNLVSIFWQWQVCVTWLWHILSICWQWKLQATLIIVTGMCYLTVAHTVMTVTGAPETDTCDRCVLPDCNRWRCVEMTSWWRLTLSPSRALRGSRPCPRLTPATRRPLSLLEEVGLG